MVKVIEAVVGHEFCDPCRRHTGDSDCPFPEGGCIEYRQTVAAACAAVLAYAKMIQEQPVWRVPGILRDTIHDLEVQKIT